MAANTIEINNLTKNYGKARGISNLSLQVKEGECFGFIGPNGAGKSTTIRTLLGFIKPTSGSAAVIGKDISKESEDIRKLTGYLPSESVFYRGMKVGDILKLSAGLRGVDCHTESKSLCERLELDTSRKADDLSFGNRKKVAIVCALQHKPSLLILDEPTSGLDPLMQREFFDILHERNLAGTTIFLSSHILSEIADNCNRAAIIREGSIIACDKVENLAQQRAKRVSLTYATPKDVLHELSTMEGVRDYSLTDNSVQRFLYTGSISLLIHQLASANLKDVTISEPDLEEIFMHYYR